MVRRITHCTGWTNLPKFKTSCERSALVENGNCIQIYRHHRLWWRDQNIVDDIITLTSCIIVNSIHSFTCLVAWWLHTDGTNVKDSQGILWTWTWMWASAAALERFLYEVDRLIETQRGHSMENWTVWQVSHVIHVAALHLTWISACMRLLHIRGRESSREPSSSKIGQYRLETKLLCSPWVRYGSSLSLKGMLPSKTWCTESEKIKCYIGTKGCVEDGKQVSRKETPVAKFETSTLIFVGMSRHKENGGRN